MDIVGRVAPQVESPIWMLQIPVPQNSETNLLFNGFCAYFEQRKNKYAAEVIIPEPGVIWGRFHGIPAPVLLSERKIEITDHTQWLDSSESPAMLAVSGESFCLVTTKPVHDEALHVASTYLERDISEHLQREYECRKGATSLFEQMDHHDSLAVISVECLMRALRPAEGNIPRLWSQSSESESPQFNVNEIFPLVTAWCLIDPIVAEELVLCVLKLQANSGAIPVRNVPHGTHSILEAPKPMLAKSAEMVWKYRKDPNFLKAAIPALRRYIQWLLHHFDQKNRGMHCWQNSNEALVTHLFEPDLATVDLTILLLTEIDALNRLRDLSPEHSIYSPYFQEIREALIYNLMKHFWNKEESVFSNGFLRGKQINVQGFPSLTPLLWKKLPGHNRSILLDMVQSLDFLPGGLNILSWRKSAVDDRSFPLFQQIIVLHAIKTADTHGTLLRDFSQLTLQSFVEWHTLSLEENNTLEITPLIATYILTLQENHQYRYHAKGYISGRIFNALRKVKADSFDLAVIIVIAFAILATHTIYKIKRTPPALDFLQAQINCAYANKELKTTMKNCSRIIRHYPDQAARARLIAGNVALLQHDFINAQVLISQVRKEFPDSPGPMIALGLACQLQGNFQDAERNYVEFCYIFNEIFPHIVQEINYYRLLSQEGFESPPKWKNIYRYKIMHEL